MSETFIEDMLKMPLAQLDAGSLFVILLIFMPVACFIWGSSIFFAFDFIRNCLTLRKRILRDVVKLLVVIDRPVTLLFVCEYCGLLPFHLKRYYSSIYSLVYEHNFACGCADHLESLDSLLAELRK